MMSSDRNLQALFIWIVVLCFFPFIHKTEQQQGVMAVGTSIPGIFLSGYPGHSLKQHTYWLRCAVLYGGGHYFNIIKDKSTKNKWYDMIYQYSKFCYKKNFQL
jgi:hypothetical protein